MSTISGAMNKSAGFVIHAEAGHAEHEETPDSRDLHGAFPVDVLRNFAGGQEESPRASVGQLRGMPCTLAPDHLRICLQLLI